MITILNMYGNELFLQTPCSVPIGPLIITTMSTATTHLAWALRPLTASDVDDLLHIQTLTYGSGLQESREVFLQRLSCPHHCSVGIARKDDNRLLAYLAAYWSEFGKVTPLNGAFEPPHEHGRVLYIHDISVLPQLAGQGAAQHMLNALFAQAREAQIRMAALVAVQGSTVFWQRLGFEPHNVTNATQLQHLRTYGANAVFMTTAL